MPRAAASTLLTVCAPSVEPRRRLARVDAAGELHEPGVRVLAYERVAVDHAGHVDVGVHPEAHPGELPVAERVVAGDERQDLEERVVEPDRVHGTPVLLD